MPAVAVCGFPRSGSTMMMTMLHAGGIPPADGTDTVGYELPDIDGLTQLTAGQVDQRAVKLLDTPLYAPILETLPDTPWSFIWMDRNPVDQTLSQLKFLEATGQLDHLPNLKTDPDGFEYAWNRMATRLHQSLTRDRPHILGLLRRTGPTLVIPYERALAQPAKTARLVARHLPWADLNRPAAAAVVHHRTGVCRDDLSVEQALTEQTDA